MLFGFLIILLALQFLLFLTGVVFDTRINSVSRTLGKVFRFLYVFDSFLTIAFAIIFGVYVFYENSIYYIEGGKYAYYILVVFIVLGNLFKIIMECFKKTIYNSGRASIFFVIYVISLAFIFGSLFEILTNEVTYVPDENRKVVKEYKYTDIVLSESTANNSKEDFFIIMIDNNNDEKVLLINTKSISSTNAQSKYIEKYEIKEIKEYCFGTKEESIYYEYIVYTPDETERDLISTYSNVAKSN